MVVVPCRIIEGMNSRVLSALALLAALWVPALAEQNLITNGSFEENELGFDGNWADYNIPTGTNSLQGWDVISTVDLTGTAWQAEDGICSIDMAASRSIGEIAQTFATTPGESYTVSFWWTDNPDYYKVDESPIESMCVSAGGTTMNYTIDASKAGNSDSDMRYMNSQFMFTAGSSSSTLEFLSTEGSRYCGIVIDNVEVEAVPEPSSLIALAPFAALVVVRRRRAVRRSG